VLPQSITNTATVSSTTPDPAAGNNTSSATNSSTTSADLSITKTHTGDFTAGLDGTYTIGVHNTGPSDAQQPVVTDTLPSGETYASVSGGSWNMLSQRPGGDLHRRYERGGGYLRAHH